MEMVGRAALKTIIAEEIFQNESNLLYNKRIILVFF